jgi:hypothetical protein
MLKTPLTDEKENDIMQKQSGSNGVGSFCRPLTKVGAFFVG